MPTAFAAKKTVIKFSQWKGPEVGQELMMKMKKAFEAKHPDIELEIIDVPFQQFHDKAVTQFRAGNLPDVLLSQVDWIGEFADLGMIAELDQFVAKEAPDFMDQYVDAFHQKYKGHLYGLPMHSGCVCLYYNKDIFAKAGVAGPPKTWEELVEVAQKVTKLENTYAFTCTLQAEPSTNMTYDIYPLMLQAGAKIVDENNNPAFNSPEGVKAVQFYVDLVNKYKVSVPGVLSNGEKEKRGNFSAGNVAMMFEGPWGISIQSGLNPNTNYDIALMPVGATSGTIVRGSIYTITSQSKNKEAAWKFIKWATGEEGATIWCSGSGDMPANKLCAEKDFIKNNRLIQVFFQQQQLPNAKVLPYLPNQVELNRLLTIEVQNAVTGRKTVQQALDDAVEAWKKVINK